MFNASGDTIPAFEEDHLRNMYAIIRAGGKQAKVHEGDVLDVELIKNTDKVSYTPLPIVHDDGSVVADTKALDKASVTVEVIGDTKGPKIDIFTYKNKTGNRRRRGHRQKYSRIKVTAITTGGSKKKAKDDAPEADAVEATEEA